MQVWPGGRGQRGQKLPHVVHQPCLGLVDGHRGRGVATEDRDKALTQRESGYFLSDLRGDVKQADPFLCGEGGGGRNVSKQ